MTDYYSLAEDGLLSILKTELASYFPQGTKQVTASDDTILDNGNNNYAISYPGNFPVAIKTSSFIVYNFEVRLDVLVRWNKNTVTAWDAFKDLRNAIIILVNHTQNGRSLGKTNYVVSEETVIQAEDRPRYVPMRGANPDNPIISHVGQICNVNVTMKVPRS